ncbi:glycine C-acetyltransferase [Fibrobacter sp. UWH9]|uniref:aminotransferase class I/II-fold pyridoxal phosphate-dependent enzyme n=1 Tax=Fibrobacter sp. UWH9 TaxID=1896213 RepID=UPI00091CC962|nr:8-amino-7-oxononanoate synthase [Fibrobacter sp. UWH9]SHH48434.1 glycine C-acetyltransferase [Fibrobacter sp. UWH9]
MSILNDFTDDVLQGMQEAHTYRTMRLLESPEASHVQIAAGAQNASDTVKSTLLLASNSYLDLCNEPSLKKAAADAVLKWGTGSGGARLTTGNKTPHEELESVLANFKGEEAAITFGTGYMANVGVISALCSKQVYERQDENGIPSKIISECIVFSDELNHASIIDGIRLSKAKCIVYKHNDMADLQRVISEARAAQPYEKVATRLLIVTDAVFSMDGDLANLPKLQKIAKENNCLLMIDEAHATGVIGKTGRGLAEHFNDMGIPCEHADVTVGTLSKAIGCEGGFVVGKQKLIDFLRNKARSFIFTTAMSPAMAQAAANNLKFIENHPERVLQLQENVKIFWDALQKAGTIPDSNQSAIAPQSAIIPIIIGDEAAALRASAELLEKGILIPAIRYPTVAKGQARLRASLMATHTKEELQDAATAIAAVLTRPH